VHAPVVVAYPVVILMTAWTISSRAALVVTGLTVVATLGLLAGEFAGVLPKSLQSSSTVHAGDQIVIYILCVALAVLLVRAYKNRLSEIRKVGADLTRRTIELELKEAELNRAQAVAKVGSWVYEVATDTFRLSAEAALIMGMPAGAKEMRESLLLRVHPDDRSNLDHAWRAAFNGDEFDHEHRMMVGPSARWIRQNAELTYAADGKAIGALGIVQDITERKLVEGALRESEERYRTAFLTSPDSVNITRLSDGLYLEVNDGFLKMLGWTREESVGRTSLDMNIWQKPEDRQRLVEALQRDGHCENLEAGFVAKDGRVVIGLMSAHMMELKGQPCVLTVTRDITERKAAEDKLRKLSQAIEQSSDSIIITNVDATIEYVNEAFVRSTGFSREDAIGKNPRILRSGKTPQETYTALWDAITHGQPWNGEFVNRNKDGKEYTESAAISPIRQPDGLVTHYLGVHTDITTKKAAEERINSLAFFDPLTELPNRRLLLDRLKQATAASARNQRYGALFFIDLDNFKTLNDTLGHDIGDLLLQQTALRLTNCVREGDTVARLGGDEFVLLLESLSENAQDAATSAEAVGEKIIYALNQPYQLAGFTCHSSPSIGVTLFADDPVSLEDLLKHADLAMYQAKEAGRNALRFFEPEMQAAVSARAALESDLHTAVRDGQFVLHYQAQVDRAGGITGIEALLRWQHPERGLVSPLTFISLAEETGLIVPIGRWVLETACTQLSTWSLRSEMSGLSIAVNVSACQFFQPDFVGQILTILEQTGANPNRLKLELTESLLVSNIDNVIAKMQTLKAIGVGFSLDDFGTGYSSLSYLKRLPLDQLKIDQSFVRDILTDPNDAAIAKMVIVLAGSLGLAVIAEGVETVAQRDFLAVQGCYAYQGYLFSKPIPIEAFEEFAAKI
jgi:diguanylate cyclase (GGDEF)-like protein/PAS domain S-box-containing protein